MNGNWKFIVIAVLTLGLFSTTLAQFTPPESPDGPTGAPVEFNLDWNDQSTNENGFKIYTNVSGEFKEFVNVTENTETANVTPIVESGRYYCFKVTAYNEYGESASSDDCITP